MKRTFKGVVRIKVFFFFFLIFFLPNLQPPVRVGRVPERHFYFVKFIEIYRPATKKWKTRCEGGGGEGRGE